ncbi:MAG: serine/threonine-protein kinase, partial [Planctomycetota bacterium]
MNDQLESSCLSVRSLDRLAGNELTTQELRRVEIHLAGCTRCQRMLDAEDGDPVWRSEIRDVLRCDADDGQPATKAPGEAIDRDEFDEDDADSMESVLELLGPTDEPHSLGRIGTYEIMAVIGQGGMGVVFKAIDAPLGRFVAIKMMLPCLAVSGAARKRFAREGRAAAAVIDDHVLPIHGVSQWRGVPYLVSQYSSGATLQNRLQAEGPFELKEILRIGMQAARGLAAAHAQGLVHRDVKPSNILLDGTVERAMLADFGLARAADDASLTRTGVVAGTPQYMSPEQARGGDVDAQSDLFGLGGVLYAMCTARAPFRADNSYAILRLIADESPRSIREINPDIPNWLCGIIAKLMAKRPSDRFDSSEQVADLLESCLGHVQQPGTFALPSAARMLESTARRDESPPKTRWWVAALFVSFLLAGVLLV